MLDKKHLGAYQPAHSSLAGSGKSKSDMYFPLGSATLVLQIR